MFGKYQFIAFREGDVSTAPKTFSINTAVLISIAVFMLVLLLASLLLAGNVYRQVSLERQLQEKDQILAKQEETIVDLVNTVRLVQSDFARVQQFNTQLRLMAGLDKKFVPVNSIGGVSSGTFDAEYLPLHRQELLTQKIRAFLKQIESSVRLEEVQQQELLQILSDRRDLLASTPSMWPVRGRISSHFGVRNSPFRQQGVDFHRGIDIAAPIGTPVYAPAKGVVAFAGVQGGYGNVIFVKHRGGLSTRYGHLDKILVKEGQKVERGDIIGHVGNTGRSTGPHLHYEVRVGGVSVNPMKYIVSR